LDNQPTAFRIETDSMGEVKLPIGALYGAQTQRAVDNFTISGLRPWRAFIWSIGVIKQASAQVNCELALLEKATADSIIQAASEVAAGKWDDQFVVDVFQAGAGTSHNMNANEVIANRATQILGGQAGEYRVHPNDHANMSQSTNDVIPAAIRLGCLWRLDELLNSVHDLAVALQAKAVEFDGILKSGRTHLQDAVPIRLGQEFGAYGKAVSMDEERIKRTGDNLRRLGIGGTAVGTGLNAHPQFHPRMVNRLSELTGMALFSSENLFESMQSMADMADFSASLRTLALTLIRIANDLRLLASGPATGLDEIRLPALQPGSSIMPGKINPVIPEMLNMAMYYIIGCDTSVAMASQAGQLELNVMMPVIAHSLFGMMHVMIGAVHAFTRRCVTGISANPQKAAYWLSLNSILITALNPLIGYRAGAELVKEAALRNLPIRQVAVEKARQGLLLNLLDGKPISVDEIEGVFQDLRRFTEGGIIPGN
jgi:fumarate hydratase class II